MTTDLLNLKQFALANKVPIIEDEGLAIILQIIKESNAQSVLEIGTAIGYSALQIQLNTNATVTSIERDLQMYEQAVSNVTKFNCTTKIELIYADALSYDTRDLGFFDVLYIDAAKAQNKKFLDKYAKHLKPNGVILFDNLLFHGLVFGNRTDLSNNVRQLVRKIEDFITEMEQHPDYHFELIKAGDGIGVCRKKEI